MSSRESLVWIIQLCLFRSTTRRPLLSLCSAMHMDNRSDKPDRWNENMTQNLINSNMSTSLTIENFLALHELLQLLCELWVVRITCNETRKYLDFFVFSQQKQCKGQCHARCVVPLRKNTSRLLAEFHQLGRCVTNRDWIVSKDVFSGSLAYLSDYFWQGSSSKSHTFKHNLRET